MEKWNRIFWVSQFLNESSLGTASEACTVDGPSILDGGRLRGCSLVVFGCGTMPFNTAGYSGPTVKPAYNLRIQINTENRLFDINGGNWKKSERNLFQRHFVHRKSDMR